MDSWYPKLNIKKGSGKYKYLHNLQNIFMVQDSNKEWVPYELTPHQIEWHLNDVALKKEYAKSRVVVKSRNTSFTTSVLISNLMAVPHFPEQVVPFVRLNINRANDLINECKKLIRHIKPVRIGDFVYPFDPNEVDMKAIGKIVFPNGVEFRAFPANSQAAETIRGLRIVGSAGIIDESNFMKDFKDIYVALRDASSGSKDGKKIFQMNIGTTLKGRTTPFKLWYDNLERKNLKEIRIYKWPVFNPLEFDETQSILEQETTPIVPWHDRADLEQKRIADINIFREEYLCQTIDSDEVFYPHDLILSTVDTNLQTSPVPNNPSGAFYMGIDVASVNDYFVMTIFEKEKDVFIQRHLHYVRQVELEDMFELCCKTLDIWKPVRCRVDAQGLGLQLAQMLRRRYGAIIDPIRNNIVKGIVKKQNIKLNEFVHTNQKMLMNCKKIQLINDEVQIMHYSSWDYQYKCESTKEWGHGDITMANGYALLPINYKAKKSLTPILMNVRDEKEKIIENVKEEEVDWE